MAKRKGISGAPWHFENHRLSYEDMRYRSKCKHYAGSGECSILPQHCGDPALCGFYSPKQEKTKENKKKGKTRGKKQTKEELMATVRKRKELEQKIKAEREMRRSQQRIKEGERSFPVGCRVKHITFGIGIVKKNSDGRICIDFKDVGNKVLGMDVCVRKGILSRV